MNASAEIEQFFGVYLLYNVNPQFKGRTYIGFTVNPNRRIQQHNKGKQAGGAWRTHGRGPWEMVLIIHGFPNEISALRFEWAWQNPKKSRRLKHLPGKTKKESQFQYRFRIVSVMLNTCPWCRFSLTIRWLKQQYIQDFPLEFSPPSHMPIAYGPVRIKKNASNSSKSKPDVSAELEQDSDEEFLSLLKRNEKHVRCSFCRQRLKDNDTILKCVHPQCSMQAHIVCLAKRFLTNQPGELIPVDGKCPLCKAVVLWGDLIRAKQGCYQNLEECTSAEEDTGEDWTDQLQSQVT
ncbi:structure-specific endonuclease subunit slx1-like [Saccostrea cucullata]|uniref:structure-specific endonuclease subunit slx1-like n=1 Tax=Saccostrea cuccullata TaxID=36930 RepID=UPI002ED21AE9